MTVHHFEVELEGEIWTLAIDRTSQHTLTTPTGKEVLAYKAVVSVVIE